MKVRYVKRVPVELNILLVDDHPIFRKGLSRIIADGRFGYSYILHANSGKEALEIVAQKQIDVIFLDVSMPEMNGYECATLILQKKPDSKIIILTVFDEAPAVLHFFKMGVKGYLTKEASEMEIDDAIDHVWKDKHYCQPKFDAIKTQWLSGEGIDKVPSVKFTKREKQLMVLITEGKTNDEMAALLGLSIRSIETYRLRLIDKAQVSNTAELCRFALKNGII